MSSLFELDFWPIAAIGGSLLSAFLLACHQQARFRKRSSQLAAANDALSRHREALEFLIDDPRTPDRIKRHALSFSEVMMDRVAFTSVLQSVLSRTERMDTHALDKDVNLLAATDEKLRKAFSTCVSAGLSSALLRFPETGELIEATFARVLGDPKKEAAVFAKAATQSRGEPNISEALLANPA
jgi:hypothetical protein